MIGFFLCSKAHDGMQHAVLRTSRLRRCDRKLILLYFIGNLTVNCTYFLTKKAQIGIVRSIINHHKLFDGFSAA